MKVSYRNPLKALVLAGCLFLLVFSWGANALAVDKLQKKAVIVVIDGIVVDDLKSSSLPAFARLNKTGAAGLMNTSTASTRLPVNTYTTIGSGARSNGSEAAGLAFNSTEIFENSPVPETFKRRTGALLMEGQIGQLGLAQIIKANEELYWDVRPGALGSELHKAGLKTAVLGNADNDIEFKRQAANIAMDDRGIVDFGDVSESVLKIESTAVVGKRTDYKKLFEAYKDVAAKANFIVIELGDTARIEDAVPYALDTVITTQKAKALKDADRFLDRLMKELDFQRDLLLVVTPTPSVEAMDGKEFLSPVMAAGPNVSKGLLTSGTTKRRGIIANTDIAAAVLNHFGLPTAKEMTGQTITSVSEKDPLDFISNLNNKIIFTYQARPILVQGYVIAEIIFIILSILAIFYQKPSPRVMKHLLLGLAAVPLTLLLLPMFPQPMIIVSVIEAIVITTILVTACYWLGRKTKLGPFIYICLGTTLIILVDLFAGAPLAKSSTLGYDPIIGARYYGIGNEYMGVIIGAAIIGVTALLTNLKAKAKLPLIIAGIVFLAITYAIAAPNLGTNVGGAISAVVGFGFTLYLLAGGKITKKTLAIGATLPVLVILILVAIDLTRGTANQSHIGRTANLIREGGIQVIFDIIVRKMAVNIKLIKYTRWSWVFLLCMGALATLFYRPIGIFQTLRSKYPCLFMGFMGVVVGSIAALIFNDSGIVAAATMMIFAAATLLYLVIEERSKPKKA